MTDDTTIIRIAARGDGVTATGKHVSGAVTGDRVTVDGTLIKGPHHVDAPCKHFATCGACQLQHADEEALTQFVHDRVVLAAEGQGIAPENVAPIHISPPRSRRRATLHFQRTGKRIIIGFREEKSHKIVDMTECHVLAPALFASIAPVRKLLSGWPQAKAGQLGLTLVDQGVDMSIGGAAPEGLEQTEGLLDFARMGDVKKSPSNLAEIIESVIDIVKPLSRYRDRNIHFHYDQPVVAVVNAQEIKQVILNLITNALGSVEAGGTVQIDMVSNHGNAILRISDNGCGMTEEVRQHLFEPFFTRRRDGQGTGLGLSITWQIIEDHGGKIQPHSDGPGHGKCLACPFNFQVFEIASRRFQVQVYFARQAKLNRPSINLGERFQFRRYAV